MATAAPAIPRRRRGPVLLGTLDRYLLRKLFTPFLLIEGGVVLFFELERALRLIYELSLTGADLRYFLPMLLALTPYFVSFGLPAAFFLALLLLLARLDDDLELQAMLANGLSLGRIARPLVLAGVLVAGLAVITVGWLEPLGRYDFRTQKVEAIASGRTARLTPGAFFVPSDNLMLMVSPTGAGADAGRTRRVFVWHRGHGGEQQLMTAEDAAFALSDAGDSLNLTLERGSVLADDPRPGHGGTHVLDFGRLAVALPLLAGESGWARGRDERELTLPELLDPGPERLARLGRHAIAAELYGRIGKAALIPLLPLLVLPLIMAARRGHRTPGAIVAAVLFVAAQATLNMVRQRAAVGQLEALPTMAAVVGGFALLQGGLMAAGRNLPSHSPLSILLTGLGHLLPARGFRQRLHLLLPGHELTSYIAVRVLLWTVLAGSVLVVLSSMAEIFLAGSVFVERGLDSADVLHYALLRLPAHALQALSAAALLGPVIAFYLLVRQRELLTVRLLGISQLRLLGMLLPVPLLLGLTTYGLAEYGVPRSEQAFARWWQASATPAELEEEPHGQWFSLDHTLVRVEAMSPDGRALDDVLIVQLDPAGAVVQRITAARASVGGDGWRLEQVTRHLVGDGRVNRTNSAEEIWLTAVGPADLRVLAASGATYSAAWARRALTGDAPGGLGALAYRSRIWRSFSLLALPFLMLLFALPITTTSHAGKGSRLALGCAVAAGSLFLVADSLMTLMAIMGLVPVATGIWVVPLAALALALAVVMQLER